MSKIKIIYLYSKMVSDVKRQETLFAGGAQKRVYQMAVHFASRGFYVFLGSDDKPDSLVIKNLENKKVKHIPLSFRGNIFQMFSVFYKLLKITQNENINIIHCNDRKTALYGYIISLFTKTKMIYTARSNFKNKKYTRHFLGKNIVAVSEGVKENLIKSFKIKTKKISIIYNGTEIIHASPEEIKDVYIKYGFNKNHRILTSVSRLSPQKGLSYLLDAIKKVKEFFPTVVVLLVGDGKLMHSLKEKTNKLSIQDNIVFCGYHTNIQQFYDISEFTIIPSLQEGLGVSAIESIMLGKPVIGTNVGGIPEIIENGKNGFLVPPKNSDLLAQKIIYLLSNPKQTKSMCEKCVKIANEKFTLTKMMDNYYDYYKKVL